MLVPQALAKAPIPPQIPVSQVFVVPKAVIPTDPTVVELKALATKIAVAHGLNVTHFLKTIGCESSWNAEAIGDDGTSFGLAQLHYPVRDWGINIEQAKTPEIALEIMASAWDRGEQGRWSCWKMFYSK